MTQWPSEDIPDGAYLFMRALAVHFVRNEIQPGCFKAHGGGMSTDWSEYSTPQQTRARALSKPPSAYGVVTLPVGGVRDIDGLEVHHAPLAENRAHTNVTGIIADPAIDKTEVRERLAFIAQIAIHPSDPVA